MSITPSGATGVIPDPDDPTTGTRVTVDVQGSVVASEPVAGLVPPQPTLEELFAAFMEGLTNADS